MKDPRDIILSPIVSEKSYAAAQNKQYSFLIDIRVDKGEVKKAIEKIFNVKVLRVNTINVKPKPKRLGKTSGYTSKKKKAIVTVSPKDKIDFFESTV
jgi:large subunit ribosomal protein L23